MQHPNFISLDDFPVEYGEIRPMIETLARRLSENGISATVTRKNNCSRGVAFEVEFSSPVVGRDARKSLVKCNGFRVWVTGQVGKDEMKEENGTLLFEESDGELMFGKWPCPVKLKGERYHQYSAQFSFIGKERRYRCHKWESIHGGTGTKSYEYDDNIGNLDFTCNIDYLAELR